MPASMAQKIIEEAFSKYVDPAVCFGIGVFLEKSGFLVKGPTRSGVGWDKCPLWSAVDLLLFFFFVLFVFGQPVTDFSDAVSNCPFRQYHAGRKKLRIVLAIILDGALGQSEP